jgi:hypothetical protein
LRELLGAPEIRAALPPQLLTREAPSNGVEAFKRTFLGHAYVWLGVGFFLLIGAVALALARPFDSIMRAPVRDGRLEPPRRVGKSSL